MLFFQDSKIESIAIHRVGNKSMDEFYQLSNNPLDFEDYHPSVQKHLIDFFIKPFYKTNVVYRFYHPNDDLELNPVYHYIKSFFSPIHSFQEISEHLAKHLYDVSTHPKTKAGEFFTVHFKGVQFEGEEHEAIALFKSDEKEPYIEIMNYSVGEFDFGICSDAVGLGKISKAVIILNTEQDQGYKVLLAENKNAFDRGYWVDEFLQLIVRNDNYFQTDQLMKLTKSFIADKLDEVFEIEKVDKADLLNKTIKYLKEHEVMQIEEFAEEVFNSEQASNLFIDFKTNYAEEYDISLSDSFDISDKAVKKSEKSFKSVLKLDKNFHLYVHGKRDYLERGFDEEKGMNFYKVYFENES